MLLLLLPMIACQGPDPGPGVPLPSEPEETGDTGEEPVFEAGCVLMADNALRVWCEVALPSPGPIRIELEPAEAGAPVRVFSSIAPSRTHEVLGWGLRPATDYTWRVFDEGGEVVEGQVRTGELPTHFEAFVVGVEHRAASSEVEAVMIAPGCPGESVVIVDRDGFVIWYQLIDDLGSLSGFVNAMTYTEDDTILIEVAKSTLVEFDLGGNVRMRADRGVHFDHFVHHELFKHDGFVYAIESTSAPIDDTLYVIDGVYVFDATGTQVDALSVGGFYPLSSELFMLGGYWSGQFPGAVDFSHTNAIHVDHAGDIWLSFRHLHAFAKLRGGPGTPGFGELLWTVVGDPSSPIAGLSDFDLVGVDSAFAGQHDVHPAADGTVLMFDNGFKGIDTSRAVRYALDPSAGTLTELDSWELDAHCPIHGSVQELPGGDVLTTCTAHGAIREYAPSAEDYSWELRATCRDFLPVQFSRGIPIDL